MSWGLRDGKCLNQCLHLVLKTFALLIGNRSLDFGFLNIYTIICNIIPLIFFACFPFFYTPSLEDAMDPRKIQTKVVTVTQTLVDGKLVSESKDVQSSEQLA